VFVVSVVEAAAGVKSGGSASAVTSATNRMTPLAVDWSAESEETELASSSWSATARAALTASILLNRKIIRHEAVLHLLGVHLLDFITRISGKIWQNLKR